MFVVMCAKEEKFAGAQFWYCNQKVYYFFLFSEKLCLTFLYIKRSNYFIGRFQTVLRNIINLNHLPVVPFMRFCLQIGVETVSIQWKNKICIIVLTQNWDEVIFWQWRGEADTFSFQVLIAKSLNCNIRKRDRIKNLSSKSIAIAIELS